MPTASTLIWRREPSAFTRPSAPPALAYCWLHWLIRVPYTAHMPNLRLTASHTPEWASDLIVPQGFEFSARFPTREDAAAFAAQFPKSAKVFAVRLSGAPGFTGLVDCRGWLVKDGVNGGVNETGLRRYRSVIKTAAKLGIEIEYAAIYGNSYPTREAFEQAAGVQS